MAFSIITSVLARCLARKRPAVREIPSGIPPIPLAQILSNGRKGQPLAVRIAAAANLEKYELALDQISAILSNQGLSNEIKNTAKNSTVYKALTQMASNSSDKTQLRELAGCPIVDVRKTVAGNVFTPCQVLHQLASDPDKNVRKTVAAHPYIHRDTLTVLENDPDADVKKAAVARRPTAPKPPVPTAPQPAPVQISPSELAGNIRQLSQHPDWRVREAAVQNQNASPAVLLDVFHRAPLALRLAMISNPKTETITEEILRIDPSRVFRLALAERGYPTPCQIIEWIDSDDFRLQLAIAKNAHTPADPFLLALANRSRDPDVLKAIQDHPAYQAHLKKITDPLKAQPPKPPSIEKLRDMPPITRRALASEKLSAELFAELARDEEHDIRLAVAQNLFTPLNVLAGLARDRFNAVRVAILGHTKVIEEAVAIRAGKREHLADNGTPAFFPSESLTNLAVLLLSDPHLHLSDAVREQALENETICNRYNLHSLLNDPVFEIRRSAESLFTTLNP